MVLVSCSPEGEPPTPQWGYNAGIWGHGAGGQLTTVTVDEQPLRKHKCVTGQRLGNHKHFELFLKILPRFQTSSLLGCFPSTTAPSNSHSLITSISISNSLYERHYVKHWRFNREDRHTPCSLEAYIPVKAKQVNWLNIIITNIDTFQQGNKQCVSTERNGECEVLP